MNRTIRPCLMSAAACITLGLASAAHASLIAYEGFTAGAGSLSSQPSTEGGAGSDPLTGYWTSAVNTTVATNSSVDTVVSTSTTANPWVSSISSQPLDGYAAQMGAGGGTNALAYRAFTSDLPTTGNVYLSLLIQREQNGTADNTSYVGLYSGSTEEIEVGNEGNGAASFGVYVNGITPTSHSGGNVNSTQLQAASSAGVYTTQLIVADLDYTDDEIKIWLDPTSTSAAPTMTATYSTPLPSSLNYMRIEASAGNSDYLGEITVGTTFADVVSGAPEPSSLALLSLSAIAILRRRRSPAAEIR